MIINPIVQKKYYLGSTLPPPFKLEQEEEEEWKNKKMRQTSCI